MGAIAVLVILGRDQSAPKATWVLENLSLLKEFYLENPIILIMIFCILHLVSSTFSIPGSCTLLNTLSGAIFGFLPGCAIVYLVTMCGASLGYFLGVHLPLGFIRKKYNEEVDSISKSLSVENNLMLILLRLSPLLPFGVVNIVLGFLRINFPIYLGTTFVGVFFDVVLLNSFGAILSEAPRSGLQEKWKFIFPFLGLVFLFYCVKIIKRKFSK